MIKRDTFVREVSDHNALLARAVVVSRIDAHAGARSACFTECNAGDDCVVGERAVAVVAIEFVWFGVVRDEEIDPAVVVIIEQCDAERLTGRIVDTCACGDVFKRAVAAVSIQRRALAFVSLRSAIRLVFSVERAVLIGFAATTRRSCRQTDRVCRRYRNRTMRQRLRIQDLQRPLDPSRQQTFHRRDCERDDLDQRR